MEQNHTEPIEQYMRRLAGRVEAELAAVFPEEWNIPSRLREAMSYSLMAGGKRLRPILVLAACEAAGGDIGKAMPAACAIELIHTYSLIHDDLPAMDNDDFRRGKPTNHKVFGDAMAILAGDALLTHAFYCLARLAHAGVPAQVAIELVGELSAMAGARGMVGGQAADMLAIQGVTGKEELDYIHTHKTGDLIVYSLTAGGRIANATREQLSALERYGYNIGLAFQIQDDILDVTGNEANLGKRTKSDEKQGKVTYPSLIGLEASRQEVARLTNEAKSAIVSAGFANPDRLLQLADFLMARDR